MPGQKRVLDELSSRQQTGKSKLFRGIEDYETMRARVTNLSRQKWVASQAYDKVKRGPANHVRAAKFIAKSKMAAAHGQKESESIAKAQPLIDELGGRDDPLRPRGGFMWDDISKEIWARRGMVAESLQAPHAEDIVIPVATRN
jgi:hypothetical protein